MEKDSTKNEPEIPIPILIVIGGLVVLTLTYAIQTRTFEDFIKYSLYVSVTVLAILATVIVSVSIKAGITKPTKEDLIIYSGLLFLARITGPLYYSIGASLKDLICGCNLPSFRKVEP